MNQQLVMDACQMTRDRLDIAFKLFSTFRPVVSFIVIGTGAGCDRKKLLFAW